MDERGWGSTLYRYRSGPAEEATRAYAKLAKEVRPRAWLEGARPRARSRVPAELTPAHEPLDSRAAVQYGLSLTELALRWPRERSAVTTTLVGHTSMAQVRSPRLLTPSHAVSRLLTSSHAFLAYAMLVGRASMAQLEEDLKYYSNAKPLPRELMWEIDRVHMRNRLPIFASTRVGKDWDGEGQIGEPIP